MRAFRVGLVASALLASTVGACLAAAHLGGPPPPSLITYRTPTRPFQAVAAPVPQLGIDIDWYTFPGQEITNAAKADVAYVRSLHANAVSISFPFFMHGRYSSRVYAGSATPSPKELAIVASTAERAGLYVSLRPLLDEKSLGISRVFWKPLHPGAWFASYQEFLLRYAEMAQRTGVRELINGTEFVQFGKSPYWRSLDRALRHVFKGTLAYANNWGHPVGGNGGPGVQETVDAYPPMPQMPADASVARLAAGWAAFDRRLPRGTVETEVDIAAVPGAFAKPYQLYWNGARLVPSVQVRWFTAACRAMASTHMGGIYFWAVGLGQALNIPPRRSDPASWVSGPGARAISACFTRLRPGRQAA